jgi:hypothetical protein
VATLLLHRRLLRSHHAVVAGDGRLPSVCSPKHPKPTPSISGYGPLPPSAMNRSIRAVTTGSGTEPSSGTASWNARMLNFAPSAFSAFSRDTHDRELAHIIRKGLPGPGDVTIYLGFDGKNRRLGHAAPILNLQSRQPRLAPETIPTQFSAGAVCGPPRRINFTSRTAAISSSVPSAHAGQALKRTGSVANPS